MAQTFSLCAFFLGLAEIGTTETEQVAEKRWKAVILSADFARRIPLGLLFGSGGILRFAQNDDQSIFPQAVKPVALDLQRIFA